MVPDRPEEMPKAYDPSRTEGPLYQFWLDGGYFKPKDAPGKEPFTVIMPPPNVTGELHLGHALTATLEDCLIRWHRMRGEPTLWLPGVDHAGIATQNVVEKEVAKEELNRHDLGREKFVERVWQWVHKYRSLIAIQHMRLGVSCDWDREVFTMDDRPQRAVRTTFTRLYDEGLIYKGKRIINWCPRCQTALSDLEVDHREQTAHLWYVRYPLLDEAGHTTDDYVVIATTRPETIVADVAVAVNPDLERWRKFVGRKALLPIIERPIPIVADEAVESEFGTGALKITPGHDPADFEIGERHSLAIIVAVAPDGTMNAEAGPYEGMERFECRRIIVADLERMGLLEKTEEYYHAIGHCDRCDTVVEPIASEQWFMKMEPLAGPAIEAVLDGRIQIIPRRFHRVYLNWMENIRDWCISRQLWWGHRIPVWYCRGCDRVIVAVEDPTACPQCASSALEQDTDVLDTWFSSTLWPHSVFGWPEETADLRYFYPTSVMETGYDLIFFWVARMIMMGLRNTGDVPFRHVYLHGLIRDPEGRKMSKSLGNVVDPLVAAEKYGTDALRFTLATGGAPGNDFRLADDKLEGGRNFANKLWNLSRFVITNLEGHDGPVSLPDARQRSRMCLEDRWIMSRLQRLVSEVDRHLNGFQIGDAGQRLHEFVWSEFADWYVEMAKVRLRTGDSSPLPALALVLDTSLRLLHPFMPFVTEAVWQNLRRHIAWAEGEALIVASWPRPQRIWVDREAEAQAHVVMDVVRAIRNLRVEHGVDPRLRDLEVYLVAAGARPVLEASLPLLESLARVKQYLVTDASAAPGNNVASAVLAEVQVIISLDLRIDSEVERARLTKQLREVEAEVGRVEGKLANAAFRAKAPAPVVVKEEERLAAARSRLAGLGKRLAEIG